jgi:hypothetical protein
MWHILPREFKPLFPTRKLTPTAIAHLGGDV